MSNDVYSESLKRVKRVEEVMQKEAFTTSTRKRFDQMAFIYDLLEAPIEKFRFSV